MIKFNESFINKRMHIKNTFINTETRSVQYNIMKARTRGDDEVVCNVLDMLSRLDQYRVNNEAEEGRNYLENKKMRHHCFYSSISILKYLIKIILYTGSLNYT